MIASARDANAEQVAALQRATALAELRYRRGDSGFLELVAAQRDVLLNCIDLALALDAGMGTRARTK